MPIDGQLNLLRMSQMDMEAHHKNSFQFPSHPALANFDSVDVAADATAANSQARKPLREISSCVAATGKVHINFVAIAGKTCAELRYNLNSIFIVSFA